MARIKVTWEVAGRHVGKRRPQFFYVNSEEFEGYDAEEMSMMLEDEVLCEFDHMVYPKCCNEDEVISKLIELNGVPEDE
jgi:hypothetical protein